MENGSKKHKLTFKNIIFLSIIGLLILYFKYFNIRGNLCHDTCSYINSELDVIKCLDACSINAEDYREPVSYTKILLYFSIVVVFWIILLRFINNYDMTNLDNILIQFLERMKRLKDKMMKKVKKEKDGYKKME